MSWQSLAHTNKEVKGYVKRLFNKDSIEYITIMLSCEKSQPSQFSLSYFKNTVKLDDRCFISFDEIGIIEHLRERLEYYSRENKSLKEKVKTLEVQIGASLIVDDYFIKQYKEVQNEKTRINR